VSKLGSLIAIPVGFALVRAIVDRIPENTTPIVPLIPEPKPETPFYPDLILREKDKPVAVTPIIPTGPIKPPSADIPFFPETAVTAGQEFIAKDPFAGLAGLKDLPFNLPLNPPRK
tara:strand:+ start:38 stop:385 length:348 start_codon:yes stop_codon:yes gene_type:complete